MSDNAQVQASVHRPGRPRLKLSKGQWTILISSCLVVGGVLCRLWLAPGVGLAVFYVGVGGLIGGATNTIAIKALFDPWPSQRFHLPFTGVIKLKRRDIEAAVASAVGQELLSREDVLRCVVESDRLDKIRDHLVGEARKLVAEPEHLVDLLGNDDVVAVLEKVRDLAVDGAIGVIDSEGTGRKLLQSAADRIREHLDREDVYFRIRDSIQQYMGMGGRVLDATGVVDYDVLTHDIIDKIRTRLADLSDDDCAQVLTHLKLALERLKSTDLRQSAVADTLSDRAGRRLAEVLAEALDGLEAWDISQSQAVRRLLELALDKIDIEKEVLKKLRRFSHEQLRQLVMDTTREHLGWLEVWGGVLGAIGGGLMCAATSVL